MPAGRRAPSPRRWRAVTPASRRRSRPPLRGAGVGAVDALLALQEVADDPGHRGRARRRGEELLDRLDDLRLALLEGRLPLATIQKLADLVAARRARVDDPRLLAILDQIEPRAAAELAKLGRY